MWPWSSTKCVASSQTCSTKRCVSLVRLRQEYQLPRFSEAQRTVLKFNFICGSLERPRQARQGQWETEACTGLAGRHRFASIRVALFLLSFAALALWLVLSLHLSLARFPIAAPSACSLLPCTLVRSLTRLPFRSPPSPVVPPNSRTHTHALTMITLACLPAALIRYP